MKKLARVLMVACAALLLVAVNLSDGYGQRRGGGGGRGGGGRGGGGGGFRGGGGGGRGGGGGFSARSSARPSVSSRPSRGFDRGSRPSSRPSVGSGSFGDRTGSDRPNRGDINRGDINRGDINRGDINIDRDIDIDDGGWWNHDHDGCCVHHPIAAAAALGTAAAVGYNAAIGTSYTTLPESCIETITNGISYWQCGTTWYQPQFYGTDTTYLVVAAPS